MIRAIIFDYGGVLMRTANPVPRREMEQRLGLPPGGAEKTVFGGPLWDEAQLGHISSDEFWIDVGQQLGLGVGQLAKFRRAFWAGDRLDEELVDLIRYLREEGYRTALLSNAPAGLYQHVEQLGITDAFDVVVVSGREGLMKPDPAIFERALAQVGVPAAAAAFVDDMQANVAAARRVGLRATRFRGLSPLRKWLLEQDVPVPERALVPLADVRALIFDWGGVMEWLPDDAHIAAWERRLALVPGTLPDVLWGDVWHQLEVSAITYDDFIQHVVGRLGLPDVETATHFLDEFYAGDRFNSEMVAAARILRDRYKVALLTNTLADQDDLIRNRFGLDVYAEFDVYINSAHVGLRKPDPAIFDLTLDHLGVVPQQAVFVDDTLRNVDSARELGIHAVQFVDPATSLPELEALLGHSIG